MKYSALREHGTIEKGDKLIVVRRDGKVLTSTAREILNPGEPTEEVILNKKKNVYFITSMAINGTSWAATVAYARRA